MTFHTSTSTHDVSNFLYTSIAQHLEHQPVLWLIPGGSSIPIAAQVSQLLGKYPQSLERLTVSLTDERYGPVGHKDSNWEQLKEAGFDLPGALRHPVLSGLSLEETVTQFNSFLEQEVSKEVYRIGFFGMGPDGHTAGILPHSAPVQSDTLAHGYEAGAFTRITMTPKAIALLDQTVLYAVGKEKYKALDDLGRDVEILDQPAQSLKRAGRLDIFSDYTP